MVNKEKTAYVGLDLDSSGGDVVEAIINAAIEDNEGVEVEDYITFKKIKAPQRLIIRKESVVEHLGRDWSLDELQIFMASYFGFIEEQDEEEALLFYWEKN
jgi:phenol hydroxylase P2 protein